MGILHAPVGLARISETNEMTLLSSLAVLAVLAFFVGIFALLWWLRRWMGKS